VPVQTGLGAFGQRGVSMIAYAIAMLARDEATCWNMRWRARSAAGGTVEDGWSG